ncbi:unnamed protein product [Brassicogethes aeneus]|uniref:Major facilitator superfamily (MFS) profile domain-containing protein n=1 Tax=Brassicogethes aeneus TaxID=1431903 RepID=A0A9P0BHV3_BRAAE|nr:unnamed protein product [Brassicogethes aeneus]
MSSKVNYENKNNILEDVIYRPISTNKQEKNGSSLYFYVTVFIVLLVTFSGGASFTWTSPVLPKLETKNQNPLSEPITTSQGSLITGMLSLGGVFGTFIAGWLLDRFGRKITLLSIALPFFCTFVALAFARYVEVFYVVRFIQGLSIGGIFSFVPIYLGEISDKNNRGMIGCLFMVSISCGVLSSYVIGPHLSVKTFSLFYSVPLLVFLVLYKVLPESPLYLATIGDKVKAKRMLMKLRSKNIEKEFIETCIFCEENTGSFKDVFKTKSLRRAFFIIAVIINLQNLSGITVILAYTQSIFKVTDKYMSPSITPIILGLNKAVFTIISSSVVDRFGRKILLIISISTCCVSHILLATFFTLQNHYSLSHISWLPIVGLLSYITGYSLGLSPIPYVLLGEIFPTNVKFPASSLINCFSFISGFVTVFVFPFMMNSIGLAAPFWLFAVVCLLGLVFISFYVFETKGLSFLEISEVLKEN